jgi:hypothetical protein
MWLWSYLIEGVNRIQSSWYCREHLEPVNIKGVGCNQCVVDNEKRQEEKEKKREGRRRRMEAIAARKGQKKKKRRVLSF